ncbi:MAG: single-stranded DNA-binding protein [Bacteroidales bacterium]|nr:single-stranded DNA-binding protein [Bacteroidales bacterium]
MAVNKVILVGNVGKDPETRYLDENTPVCKFPLATSEVYKNRDGEKIEQTEWHNIVLWRGLAKVAEQYVKKGAQLFIEGRIRSRSYDDKDGIKRYITEIVGDNMQMLGRRQDNDQQQDSGSYQQDSGNSQQSSGSSQQQGNNQQNSSSQSSGSQGSGPQNNDQQQSRTQSPGNQQPQSSSSAGGANPDIDGPGNEQDDLPF